MDALEIQSDTLFVYVNKASGEVEVLLDDEHFDSIQKLEDRICLSDDEDEREQLSVIKKILFSNEYLPLPGSSEVDEYQIMKDFSESFEDARMRDNLLNELVGKAAFRRFINFINLADLEEDWCVYRYERIKGMVIEWCQENSLKYSEEEKAKALV